MQESDEDAREKGVRLRGMLIKNGGTKPLIEMKPMVGGAVLWIQVTGSIEPIAEEINQTLNGGNWELKFQKVKKKKTLDQTGYAWSLIDRLAASLRTTPKEVYRDAIRDIAGVSDILCAKNEAVEDFIKSWESRGLGWQVETSPSTLPGCTRLQVFYGMSVYDTNQMSALIDRLIEECKAQGIPTLTPREIAEMENR